MDALEKKIKQAIERSQSQTGKIPREGKRERHPIKPQKQEFEKTIFCNVK